MNFIITKKNIVFLTEFSLFFILISNSCCIATAQNFVVLRETISKQGYSSNLNYKDKSILVQQSIGQLSVSGTHDNGNLIVHEGFLQPLSCFKNISVFPQIKNKELDLLVFPNPFLDQIFIRFQEEMIGSSVEIKIFDSYGKLSYKSQYEFQRIKVLDLSSIELVNGVYHLSLSVLDRQKNIKLIHLK